MLANEMVKVDPKILLGDVWFKKQVGFSKMQTNCNQIDLRVYMCVTRWVPTRGTSLAAKKPMMSTLPSEQSPLEIPPWSIEIMILHDSSAKF